MNKDYIIVRLKSLAEVMYPNGEAYAHTYKNDKFEFGVRYENGKIISNRVDKSVAIYLIVY